MLLGKRHWPLWILVLVFAFVFSLYFVDFGARTPNEDVGGALSPPKRLQIEGDEQEKEEPGTRLPTPNVREVEAGTTKSVVEEYWGMPLEEVLPLLDLKEINPEQLPRVAEWEVAKAYHVRMLSSTRSTGGEMLYRRLMAWPPRELALPVQLPLIGYDKLTWEYLDQKYSLSEPASEPELKLNRLVLLVDGHNDQLDAAIRQYMHELEKAEDLVFSRDEVQRYPLARPLKLPPNTKGHTLVGRTASARGWKTRISIYKSDFPYLCDLKDEVDRLIEERNQAVIFAYGEL